MGLAYAQWRALRLRDAQGSWREAFLRATLKAIATGPYDDGERFRGDPRSGDYVESNGCGDHVAIAWSAEGVVAIAFDHEMNDEAGIEPALWNPERHFKGVPGVLEPLVQRAIQVAMRQATGAVWITAARWDDVGSGTSLLEGFAMRPEDVLFGDALLQTWLELLGPSDAQGRLAVELAAAAARGERRTVTRPRSSSIATSRPACRLTGGISSRRWPDRAADSTCWSGCPSPRTSPRTGRATCRRRDQGMIAWGHHPGASAGRGEQGVVDPAPASSVFADVPDALRELVAATTRWTHASPLATEALWLLPGATSLAGVQGSWGHPASLRLHGAYGTSARDRRTPGWPRDALAMREALASRAFSMSRLAARGEYPTITETDEALMLQAPPDRSGAPVRQEGVATAVAMLRQLGIAWAAPTDAAGGG